MNSKQKGNIGISSAIDWLTRNKYIVSIPLTDSQDYDLVAELKGLVFLIQCKFTDRRAPSGAYLVSLRSISGSSRKVYKTVNKSNCTHMFVVAADSRYLIPREKITNNNTITLPGKFIKYKLK